LSRRKGDSWSVGANTRVGILVFLVLVDTAQVAAVTKLTRNMFLAAVIPALAWVNARNVAALAPTTAGIAGVPTAATGVKLNMKTMFPVFVLGFVGMFACVVRGFCPYRHKRCLCLCSPMLAPVDEWHPCPFAHLHVVAA
jgi:uncharacterized membrane protein YadS